jgi:hypothetical protein
MSNTREKWKADIGEGGVENVPSVTISDRVGEVIDEAVDRASWKPLLEQWGKSRSRDEIVRGVRVGLWRTDEGRALRDLDVAKGAEPYTPSGVASVRKSKDGARFAKALGLLDSGFPEVG